MTGRPQPGVHVHAPAPTLDGLRRNHRFVAVPLHLAPGEMRRLRLPSGGWMLTMLPEEDSLGIRLRIEDATCSDAPDAPLAGVDSPSKFVASESPLDYHSLLHCCTHELVRC